MQKSLKVIIVVGICILIGGMGFVLIYMGGDNGIESPPVNPAVDVTFTDTDPDRLEIGGNITITRAVNESDITHYVLYWGSGPSTKSGPAISEIAKTGSDLTYPISQDTPLSATHFLVYAKNNDGEMATGVNVSISDDATPTERLQNRGFESGMGVGWVQIDGSWDIIYNTSDPGCEVHTGIWSAWHGGDTSYTDCHYQEVTISPNATVVTLSYYYFIKTDESGSTAWDNFAVGVNTTALATYSNLDDTASSWVFASHDLTPYIGTTIRVVFESSNDNSDITSFFIDDVSLLADD